MYQAIACRFFKFDISDFVSFSLDVLSAPAAMSDLIQQFASSQSQSQLGLASQAFGLNSGSNSHPFLEGSTSDCKFELSPLTALHPNPIAKLLTALQPVHWALP